MSYDIYKQLFPIEQIRKGIMDVVFENYSEDERNAIYEAFLEKRMDEVKYLLMPGPEFNIFKIITYFEYKRGEETKLKDIFMDASLEPHEFECLMIDINDNDKLGVLYRIKNISKETFAAMGIDIDQILKDDQINFRSEEFFKLKEIAQELNLFDTRKKKYTDKEYTKTLHGKLHLIDNLLLSYKSFLKEVNHIYPGHKRFNIMKEYMQLALGKLGIKECDEEKMRVDLMKSIFGFDVNSEAMNDDMYYKALNIIRTLNMQMETLKSTSIYSYRKRENKNIHEAVEYFKNRYDLNEWEILYTVSELGGYISSAGISVNNSNFVSIKLENEFSISTIIHETLHSISCNGGRGLMINDEKGTGLNEAVTEYFAQKVFVNIRDNLEYKHDKSEYCAYKSTITLIEDFITCYEEELIMDYLKNGYKKSRVKDIVGNEEYDKLIDLIDQYHNMRTRYPFFEKFDDRDLCANFQQHLDVAREENKEKIQEYHDLILEIREMCVSAIEKKQHITKENKTKR